MTTSRKAALRTRWRSLLCLGGSILFLPVLLASLAVLLEYRTHVISVQLGEYLLTHNAQRPKRGAIWQAIKGSRESRALLAPIPPDKMELSNIPPALLRSTYDIEVRSSSLVLRAEGRATPLQPGRASREEMQALARSLNAFSVGKDLLHSAILSTPHFRQQARFRLDSMLADGAIFPALDRQMSRKEIPES